MFLIIILFLIIGEINIFRILIMVSLDMVKRIECYLNNILHHLILFRLLYMKKMILTNCYLESLSLHLHYINILIIIYNLYCPLSLQTISKHAIVNESSSDFLNNCSIGRINLFSHKASRYFPSFTVSSTAFIN